MARRQRFHSPTSTFQVMLRGNDGQPIFFSERDKSRLCLLMQQGSVFFVREFEHISFASSAKILGRDSSTLKQLASRFEIEAISDQTVAKNVENMRRWLQSSSSMKN